MDACLVSLACLQLSEGGSRHDPRDGNYGLPQVKAAPGLSLVRAAKCMSSLISGRRRAAVAMARRAAALISVMPGYVLTGW